MNKVATDDIGFAIYQVDLVSNTLLFRPINHQPHPALLWMRCWRILSVLQAMHRWPDKAAHPAVMPHVHPAPLTPRANQLNPVRQCSNLFAHLLAQRLRLYSTCGGTTGYAIRLRKPPALAPVTTAQASFHSPRRFWPQVAKAMSTFA